MKIKALAAAIVLSMTSGAVLAQDYQFDVGVDYTDVEDGDGAFGAYAEYHFSPVDTADRPLAEAAFLTKSSNVYVRGAADFDVANVGVEFYIPNSMFFVAADFQRTDFGGGSDNTWSARLGITPIDGLLITTTVPEEDYEVNLQAKYVTALGGNNFLNLEADYQDGGDFDDSYSLFADYYFSRSFSFGVGYAEVFGSDVYTIRTRNFFTETFSGELSYTDYDSGSAINVGASLRF
jgi:hypothetical protein